MLLFRMSAFARQGPESNKYRLPTGTKSSFSPGKDKSAFREKEVGTERCCAWKPGTQVVVHIQSTTEVLSASVFPGRALK